ncbi:MAG: hypothetical protein ACQERB_13340 [Promethearchaeati archaeon]
MCILVLISLFITFYFNLYFDTDIIFSHFFYLPITISILWWKKHGLIIVGILSIILIFLPFITRTFHLEYLFDNLIRVLFFILIGIVLTILTEKLANSERKLRERVKELDCLYKISNVLCQPISAVDDIFKDVLKNLRVGFQFPEDVSAKIIFQGKEYFSKNYEETPWKISYGSKIYENSLSVEIYYLKSHNFLEEEFTLLKDIVQQLKSIFEFKLEYL